MDGFVGLLLVVPSLYLYSQIENAHLRRELDWAFSIAIVTGVTTWRFVPRLSHYTLKAGLKGRDLCKKGTELGEVDVPESLGIVSGVLYLLFIIVAQVVFFRTPEQLLSYNSSLLSICFMLFLGFLDDVVDLPWRYKFLLPTVASLPLLSAYSGVTWVKMPMAVGPMLMSDASESGFTMFGDLISLFFEIDKGSAGTIVRLGVVYYIYMGLLAVFCTNAINIYAGINGLEAGQALVIGTCILFMNLFELYSQSSPSLDHPHMFSVILIAPFIGTTLGLLRHNWFPSSVFVGDTFCYFAGMTLAVAGIQGHFSKTLLLFFVPQIFNFLYSVPQIFKLYPCPRHRLPRYDSASGLMYPSQFVHNGQTRDNMTLINLALRVFGPMTEHSLVRLLLVIQIVSCAVALALRYSAAVALYGNL